MTRDPSDGTVREKPVLETGISGLPVTNEKPDELVRLEISREWLRDYRLRTTAGTESPEVTTGDQRPVLPD
jgi:hypothetical protein